MATMPAYGACREQTLLALGAWHGSRGIGAKGPRGFDVLFSLVFDGFGLCTVLSSPRCTLGCSEQRKVAGRCFFDDRCGETYIGAWWTQIMPSSVYGCGVCTGGGVVYRADFDLVGEEAMVKLGCGGGRGWVCMRRGPSMQYCLQNVDESSLFLPCLWVTFHAGIGPGIDEAVCEAFTFAWTWGWLRGGVDVVGVLFDNGGLRSDGWDISMGVAEANRLYVLVFCGADGEGVLSWAVHW